MVMMRLFAAALLVQLAAAMPSMWVSLHITPQGNGQTNPPGLTCMDHPEVATWTQLKLAAHGLPVVNPNIVFTVTDPLGAPAVGICPETTYTVQVQLPTGGNMFLTSTACSITVGTGVSATANTCGVGSRMYTNAGTVAGSGYPSLYSQSLRGTCAQLANQASITLRATYAEGQSSYFKTNTITIPVNPDCYNITCPNGGSTPAPSPSPAPPAPPPSSPTPNPGSRPVYPDCINAPLLANPCPLGKRCFYDRECKPQMEDLVAPYCDNAVPLKNPWPAGKCCFYDSQCKPQCEDLTNSQCKALNIPPCSVTGCGWCNPAGRTICDRCWTGYTLNLQTRTCDCAPGYYGTTSCKLCPKGAISYGGKLPTAACVTCPAGRVANKEQTECVLASAWDHWGYDLTNRRWGYGETTLNVSNIAAIRPKWTFTAGSDVTATPTIANGRLYVPDWSGKLWCLDAVTGATIWSQQVLDLVLQADPHPYPAYGNAGTIISRASPAIAGNLLVVSVMKKGGGYPYLLTLNAADGTLVWGKRVDPHPAAMLTMSPTVHAGYIYQGVSSLEELWATKPDYPCCTFRGNMIKVDLATGNIMWRTYMTPDNNGTVGGFSGNSLWGSSPAVDLRRNQVYIATGNNYEAPEAYTSCIAQASGGNITPENYAAVIQCEKDFGDKNYHNSMVALDLTTGEVKWVRQLGGPDAWNGACMMQGFNPNCGAGLMDLNSPDYDFGQAPMLVKACKAGFCKQLVVAGQKSGWLWALNPDTGDVHWSVPVGPGGTVGGLQWGSAADNTRIYVANNNYLNVNADLTKMKSVVNFPTTTNQLAPTSTDGGMAAAVDAYTGEILWTFANPTIGWDGSGKRARSQAPMTVVNDIVLYPSMDPDGTLFMLDARTGRLLNSFQTGQTTGCGPSVVDGRVYIGSGYVNFGLGQQGFKLHMLALP